MASEYISSMISKYGDTSNLSKDVKTLNDIMNRQGTSLLIDVIAEYAGNVALKFHIDSEGRNRLRESLVTKLKEAINERI